MRYLAFDLHGPMAAWGDIGLGTDRPSFAHPTRSAVLGLIASALGYAREDDRPHAELREGLGIAALVTQAGAPLRDYHTVQVPPTRSKIVHPTRRSELTRDPLALNTMLTSRDYFMGAWYAIAAWKRAPTGPSLEDIRVALAAPRYPLFLGRRSCPLAIALEPRLVEAGTHIEAFRAAAQLRVCPLPVQHGPTGTLFHDEGDPDAGVPHAPRTIVDTWDDPTSIGARRFRPRRLVRVEVTRC